MSEDQELIEPFAIPEIFVDGFVQYEVHDGILTFVGYRKQRASAPVAVLRLVMPVVNLMAAIHGAMSASEGSTEAAESLMRMLTH